jgi:competence protein ComEC
MLWFHLFTEIKQQRNHLFLWSPMAFAFGIAGTFSQGHWVGPALFIFLLICVLGYLSYFGVKDSAILPVLILLGVGAIGAGTATLRSYSVWAPALSYPYYGEVQGVIQGIDRSASGSLRVTLRVAAMEPISERHRPSMCAYHFRNTQALSLRWAKVFRQQPISHHLKGPLNPVGLIFAVMPIFKVWVALDMPARGLNNLICPVSINFGRIINDNLSDFIAAHIPERSLGFAQAIISGDRLNLSLDVIEDLRRTNLAHLLAISGLHMGLLTTVVFGLLRMICVITPIGQIRWHALFNRCAWGDFGWCGLFRVIW